MEANMGKKLENLGWARQVEHLYVYGEWAHIPLGGVATSLLINPTGWRVSPAAGGGWAAWQDGSAGVTFPTKEEAQNYVEVTYGLEA
jgi:hypothetical protein